AVHKCSVRVLLPRPNVQGIERRKTETIRALEVMEKLSLELGRLSWMSFIPRIGKKKVVGANQAQASSWNGLINDDLRQRRVDLAVGSHRRGFHGRPPFEIGAPGASLPGPCST